MVNDEFKNIVDEMAKRHKVSPEIHSDDFIFKFLYENPAFEKKENSIGYYFNDGANSASSLKRILADVCKLTDLSNVDLLEFASGYGCVTRHLKNGIAPAALPPLSG